MSQLAQVSRWVKGFSSAPVLLVGMGKAERPSVKAMGRNEPCCSMMLIQELCHRSCASTLIRARMTAACRCVVVASGILQRQSLRANKVVAFRVSNSQRGVKLLQARLRWRKAIPRARQMLSPKRSSSCQFCARIFMQHSDRCSAMLLP